MNNARFDVTQYASFNAFRSNVLEACKRNDARDLQFLLSNPKSSEFLWMREAPVLFGSNLCQELIFDGFTFYSVHSVPLAFDALSVAIAARHDNVCDILWTVVNSKPHGPIDFLVHYFKSETPDHVSAPEREIVVGMLKRLSSDQRAQLVQHKTLQGHVFFNDLWEQSQNAILAGSVEQGSERKTRKL